MPIQVTLPTAPTPAARSNPRLLLLYGPPKVGKTTAIAALPDTLLLECEPSGADHVQALKLDIPDLPTLMAALAEVRKANNSGKRMRIALDTIDAVEAWCEGEATIGYKASTIGKGFIGDSVLELPKGAGYLHLRTEFHTVLRELLDSAYEIIVLGHVRDKSLGTAASEVSSKDLDLTGKIRNIMCAKADAIAYVSRDKESRLIANFRTTDTLNCGARCSHLKGREIVLGEMVNGETVFHWERVYLPASPSTDASTNASASNQ